MDYEKEQKKTLIPNCLDGQDKGTQKAKQPFFCSSISKLEVLIYGEHQIGQSIAEPFESS